MQQQQQQQQQQWEQPRVSVIERVPVIHEQIREMEREVVQPVINREREQVEIHQITQPLHQREIRPTIVEQRTLQEEERPVIREQPRSVAPTQAPLQSSSVVAPVMREVFQQQPIVEEVVHRTIREEIQPVLYRETIVPRVIQEMKPIYEKIVEAPRIFKEERAPIVLKEGETWSSLFGQQPRMNTGQGGQGMNQQFVGGPAGNQNLNMKPPFANTSSTSTSAPLTGSTSTSTSAPLTGSTSGSTPLSTGGNYQGVQGNRW
jgi:hypothetical protein